jgi:hypothetical protein
MPFERRAEIDGTAGLILRHLCHSFEPFGAVITMAFITLPHA